MAILAGIKTAAVINVGTATLAALIGAGHGPPILTGIRLDDFGLILQRAIPAAIMAIAAGAGDLRRRQGRPRRGPPLSWRRTGVGRAGRALTGGVGQSDQSVSQQPSNQTPR